MPVSYLSKEVQTSPYVLPVDLGLLAKVNSYKQGMFYQNAQKVSDQLGQLGNLDIANATQKAYLTNSINNVTQKINDYGGIDYSDMNISHSIENLGNEVIKDDNIINAVASTKKVRDIQSNYAKMANDPKLSKFYRVDYETYDYEHYIKPYLTSDNLKASYDGPVNPTIYGGNVVERMSKLLKTVNPNITQERDASGQPTGGYIDIVTKKQFQPEQITSMLDGLMDGQLKTELQKQAWYTLDYSNRKPDGTPTYSVDDYARMATQQNDGQIDILDATLKGINEKIKKGDTNPETLDAQKFYLEKLDATHKAKDANDSAFRRIFKENKEAALTQLYVNDLKNNLVNIFGAEQKTVALKADLTQAQEWKKEIEYLKKGFKYNGLNADGSPKVSPLADAKEDPNLGTSFRDLAVNTETPEEAKKHLLTTDKLLEENNNILSDVNNLTKDFIGSQVRGNTALSKAFGVTEMATTDKNSAPIIKYSKILSEIGMLKGDGNLSIDDINDVLDKAGKASTFSFKGKSGEDVGLSADALTYLRGISDNYNKIVNDVDNDTPISEESRKFFDTYRDKMSIVNSNKDYLRQITSQVSQGMFKNLNSDQRVLLNTYFDNPDAKDAQGRFLYKEYVETGGNGLPSKPVLVNKPEINKLLKATNLSEASRKEKVDAVLSTASNRLNYFVMPLKGDANNLVEKTVPGLKNKVVVNNETFLAGKDWTEQDIKPISVGKDDKGWYMRYSIKVGKTNEISGINSDLQDIRLTSDEVNKLGVQGMMPYEGLEREAYTNGMSEKHAYIPTLYNIKSDGTVANTPKPVKIRVVRTSNDRNNNSYAAQVFVPSTNDWQEIKYRPEEEMYKASANSAYWFATEKLRTYGESTVFGVPVTMLDPSTGKSKVTTVRNVDSFYKDIILNNK